MKIDDPLDQAEAQVGTPASLPEKMLSIALRTVLPAALQKVGDVPKWLDKRNEENLIYLVKVLSDELRRVRGKLDDLCAQHPEFWREDYPALLLDGLRRAEQIRAKSRINRIAKILARAALVGPSQLADDTEELMRTAMDLTDWDVLVLGEVFAASEEKRPMQIEGRPLESSDVVASPAVSALAKLVSFGLIVDELGDRWQLARNEAPFGILPKGRDFIRYIRGVSETEMNVKDSD